MQQTCNALQLNQVTSNYEITQLGGCIRSFEDNVIILEDVAGELIKIEFKQIRNCFLQ